MRLIILILCFFAMPASASDSATKEAGKHFQRGVDLYNDGDFRGALVEFKKAYETWPRANVLYDIGQTQFQLLDYAGALTTMNRYLAETGAGAPHRAEVETTVETLRGRVGRIAVTTESGCDVLVDDEPAGTSPLMQSLLVSIGPRRVTVKCQERPAVSRQIEVTAGDRLEVEIKVPAPMATRSAQVAKHIEGPPSKVGWIAGWTVTGLLVVGTVAVGSSTLVAADRLAQLKDSYPVQRATLDRQATLVNGLSIASDVIGACALVSAALSTWATVKYKREASPKRFAFTANGVSF
jgi:hypothetical protein